MGIWSIFSKLFGGGSEETIPLTPEVIESLPEADDASFYRDSKRLLQRFDEFITTAEAECEALSIELDNTLEMQDILKQQLQSLNKPNSWHERHLLLKLDRLQLHGENLQQRIEIYSQNIKVYLNLISKIQDIKAMRMNGLDEEKIETIWVEFKETLEEYKHRITTEEAGFNNEEVISKAQEDRLRELRASIMGPAEKPKNELKRELKEKLEQKEKEAISKQRESLDSLMSRKNEIDDSEPELVAE